jgi:hypothetical protein
VVKFSRRTTRSRDRESSLTPKFLKYTIWQRNVQNEAITLKNFHVSCPDGRLDGDLPEGWLEGYMERFAYD